MGYDFYVTPEEYAKAEAVGISPALLNRRIRERAWSKERAMTTPPRALKDRSHWAQVAKENGIPRTVFDNRISRMKWDEEKAATQPLRTDDHKREHMKKVNERKRVYSDEIIALYLSNGITKTAFMYRMHAGWSLMDAATKPMKTPSERGKAGAKTLKERYRGDTN